MGRIAARAHGVRRILSRRVAGLLPLHRVSVTVELRSAGYVITAVSCLDTHASSWKDPHTFSCAHQGIELLLKLTEEGEPLPELYALTHAFLRACHARHPEHLVHVFTLKLLHLLGLFPSVTHSAVSHLPFRPGDQLVVSSSSGGVSLRGEAEGGVRVSEELRSVLAEIPLLNLHTLPPCPRKLSGELQRFVQGLLGNQLGVELASPAVSLAISSGVTPT